MQVTPKQIKYIESLLRKLNLNRDYNYTKLNLEGKD